jgi:hypothetical protein
MQSRVERRTLLSDLDLVLKGELPNGVLFAAVLGSDLPDRQFAAAARSKIISIRVR